MSKAEKFIQDCTRNCSNEMESPLYANPKLNFYPWLTPDQARTAVEIAREEIYEWLQKISFDDYKVADEESYRMGCPYDYIDVYGLINNLKQAIKDSQYGR
jgi:hypothetical protein